MIRGGSELASCVTEYLGAMSQRNRASPLSRKRKLSQIQETRVRRTGLELLVSATHLFWKCSNVSPKPEVLLCVALLRSSRACKPPFRLFARFLLFALALVFERFWLGCCLEFVTVALAMSPFRVGLVSPLGPSSFRDTGFGGGKRKNVLHPQCSHVMVLTGPARARVALGS